GMTAAMPMRKSKKTASEETPKTPQPADAPVQDGAAAANAAARSAAVKSLIERGKKKGSVTYDEVAAVSMAFDEEDPEKSNDLVEEIMAAGIEITDLPDLGAEEKEDAQGDPEPVEDVPED